MTISEIRRRLTEIATRVDVKRQTAENLSSATLREVDWLREIKGELDALEHELYFDDPEVKP